MDYANGKIYKLCSSNTPLVYIGSTCSELKKRKHHHKASYNRWLNGKRTFVTSFELFQAGGTIDIILIEEFPCKSKMELERRERYHIERIDCVNKCKPAQTREERLGYQKEYYEVNREAVLERRKEYHEANREAVLERMKEHYKSNREVYCQYQKDYYDANKGPLLEKVKCTRCGSEVAKMNLSRHQKTQKCVNSKASI